MTFEFLQQSPPSSGNRERLQMIMILAEYYVRLTVNSTLFLITLTCLSSYLQRKRFI